MIPRVDDLASHPLVHRFGDVFNPPGLASVLGCVQADLDVTGIRSLNFPPFACSDSVTAGLYLDGRYFPSIGRPVTYTWRPDRIVRTAEHNGFRLRSTTVLALRRTAAVVVVDVENLTGERRDLQLRLALKGTVTQQRTPWAEPLAPHEDDNEIGVDPDRMALVFRARHSEACSVQGTWPRPDHVELNGLTFRASIAAGSTWRLTYVNAIGAHLPEALVTYDAVVRDAAGELARVEADWNAELAAIFTPGNDRYSGSLPVLETDDDDIRRLYHLGILGVAYFKRESPYSVLGRTYDTLMPRYWQTVTFLWDYSLSSGVHALLDPSVMRRYLEHWMSTDIHTHMGTEWLSASPVGEWYSVNDFAMTRTMREYLRWTGDTAWLTKELSAREGGNRRVIDFLVEYARNWERFRSPNGLADYGDVCNLLECVSTYVHEVASLNAANVFNIRFAAEALRSLGEHERAATLAEQADALVKEVMALYAEGQGCWYTRFPDGWLVPVRHCYDFITVLRTIPGDLSPTQRDEMARFFERELQTPTWMHALSYFDPDATFSVRPDHQWTGAYPAWPAEAAAGLYRIGEVDLAFKWLKGMAATTNQGPFGQAHFAETVIEPEAGGARKAPPDLPYITDWCCAANGAWASVVIESIFGVEAGLDGTIKANPRFGAFDPDARLVGLNYQGRRYDVDRTGLRP